MKEDLVEETGFAEVLNLDPESDKARNAWKSTKRIKKGPAKSYVNLLKRGTHNLGISEQKNAISDRKEKLKSAVRKEKKKLGRTITDSEYIKLKADLELN